MWCRVRQTRTGELRYTPRVGLGGWKYILGACSSEDEAKYRVDVARLVFGMKPIHGPVEQYRQDALVLQMANNMYDLQPHVPACEARAPRFNEVC
jgi:hypothetical protein